MSFYFENHPVISYNLTTHDAYPKTVQNLLVRYKLKEVLKKRTRLYYIHRLEEGQTIQFIADRYYDDSSLDWVIYITNDIFDMTYDLPLDYLSFNNYIRDKYGSVPTAQSQTHHYEWIYQASSKLSDGTIIKEKTLEVDATTYAGLIASEKREVSNYDYEVELNDSKRELRIMKSDYLNGFLAEAKGIFA